MHKIPLNYNWNYCENFKEEYITKFPKMNLVNIPHTNKELPFYNFSEKDFQFISSYEKVINISVNKQKRYVLQFDGIMNYSEVYFNEVLVTSHKGGYTPFKVDVSEHIVEGENKLFVKVDSTERSDTPPYGFVIDYLTYGGIYREVYLIEYEREYIDQVFIEVNNSTLELQLFLEGDFKTQKDCRFEIIQDNIVIESFNNLVDFTKEKSIIFKEVSLEKWTIDNPVLYALRVFNDDTLLYESRFGNRSIEVTTQGLYLNKKHIKLIGLNRHQSYPYVGYAMPSNAQKKDADILKYELGLNTVRSSHYPPSKHFLDRCDEIGLLVFNEIPGWQHIGDLSWQEVAIKNTHEMIYRDYNHPSIFIWGTRINESPDNDSFYQRTSEVAKSLDKYRPTGGVRNFSGSSLYEDVYTYNDFVHRGSNKGLQSRMKVTKKDVPYMVTEYNGHMFPTKKFDDEYHRVEHTKRHLNVQQYNHASNDIIGAIGWCMFDYNTHKDFGSGDRICYHGVMDMFRIPKYAASVYAVNMDDPYLEVLSNLNIGEKEASEIKEVYVMSNADFDRFKINEDVIGDFYPSTSEEYKNLPNPPIIIKDFIGNLIHDNESYTKKDCDVLKEVMLSIMQNGMSISLRLKIKMYLFLRKHKLSMDQAAKFYEKYVGKWGLESITYTFEAYKNNKIIASKKIGSTDTHQLTAVIDDSIITETDTYQTTRVVVKHVNELFNNMDYSSEIIKVSLDGPLEIIGPDTLPLLGGSTGFYVKTVQKKGVATINITSTNLKPVSIKVEIK
jgi:beta-galactosidase